MPTYAYTARDGSGAAITGTLQANSVNEVTQMLRNDGKYPVSIKPAAQAIANAAAAAAGPVGASGLKIARAEVIQIATQLSIMIETGVTLSEALDCVATQAQKPNVKRLLDDLTQQVQAGTDFSAALARHPRSFPRLFTALIKASERSGMMGKLLNRATHYMRDEQETLRRVKGALTYPAIMLGFAMTTTIFLLAFVMPRFTKIYAQKQAALPAPTQILMSLSNFMVAHYLALILAALAAATLSYFYFRTPSGQRLWHYVQLNIPLFGPLFRKVHLSRGLRMIGTMAGAGVSLLDCVQTAESLTDNGYFRDLWASAERQIQAGKQLSEPLFESALVPRSVSQMLHSGEKSGKLAFVMEQVAGFAEAELKEQIAQMTRYIEPLMIIVMGFIIGGVALALLLPIFTISKVVAH
jgi:type IV pilus assembly protein PilC